MSLKTLTLPSTVYLSIFPSGLLTHVLTRAIKTCHGSKRSWWLLWVEGWVTNTYIWKLNIGMRWWWQDRFTPRPLYLRQNEMPGAKCTTWWVGHVMRLQGFGGRNKYHFNARDRNLTRKPCTLIVCLVCSRHSQYTFRQCARWNGEGIWDFVRLTKGALQRLGVKIFLILK